jgi:hypothetical protein
VNEVEAPLECGLQATYVDWKEGDVIDAYNVRLPPQFLIISHFCAPSSSNKQHIRTSRSKSVSFALFFLLPQLVLGVPLPTVYFYLVFVAIEKLAPSTVKICAALRSVVK